MTCTEPPPDPPAAPRQGTLQETGSSLPELAGRIRASPAEERTAVLGWSEGVGGAAGAWELTFGARNFDGPAAGNGGKWTWQHFSDETYVEGGSFGYGRVYGHDSRGEEVAAVVNGVVEALRSRPEKGALLVIVDPLLNSGAAAADALLPALATRMPRWLLRALIVVPHRATVPDDRMDTLWSYNAVLVGAAVLNALRTGTPPASVPLGDSAQRYDQSAGDKDFDDAARDYTLAVRPLWAAQRELGRIALVPRGEWVAMGSNRSTTVTLVASQLHANHLWFDPTDINADEVKWLLNQFDGHWCKRAWVHCILSQGVEQGEFEEARDDFDDLRTEVEAWGRSGQMVDYAPYKAPRAQQSGGSAKWWTVCVGSAAEALARDAGFGDGDLYDTIPDDMDDFDRAEKDAFVLIVDVQAFEGRHTEPLLSKVYELLRGSFLQAIVIAPKDPPDASPKAREDWAVFVHMIHYFIEHFDSVLILPADNPGNVVALKVLKVSRLSAFFTPLAPFPRMKFFTVVPTGISAPRPLAGGGGGADELANWRTSVNAFLDAAMIAAPHANIERPVLGPDNVEKGVDFGIYAEKPNWRLPGQTPEKGEEDEDGETQWIEPPCDVGQRLEARYNGGADYVPCTVVGRSGDGLDLQYDQTAVLGLERFAKPFCMPLLNIYSGDRLHRLGPEAMLPKSVGAVARWCSSTHVSVALEDTDDEAPQFMTITLFVPVVMALVTTAREALYAIFEDESAKAALKARLKDEDGEPDDTDLTEAESNASDFVSELEQYIDAS